jgi:flagellar assembly protein FliH
MNSSKDQFNTFVPEKIVSPRSTVPSGWQPASIPADGQNTAESSAGIRGTDEIQQEGRMHSEAAEENAAVSDGEEAGLSVAEAEAQEKERLRQEAYDEGLRDGLKMADQDFGAATKVLTMACEQINTLRETILNNSMGEMQDLVLAIAEKIIRHSVTEQSDTIVATVEEAIRQAVKTDELIIEVHPADLAIIKSKARNFIDSLSGLENIVVQANPAIERGGCRIDSSTSTVDATLAGQLQAIEKAIKGKD